MRTLSKIDLLKSKFGNNDVSIVWSSDLKKMVKENEDLHSENTLLKMQILKMEEEIDTLKNIQDCTTFVRLYA
jgi:hypothetical protein